MKFFRWKAIVPMVLLLGVIVILWLLYIDRAIRKGIEFAGTELVGAKVELASARLRLTKGTLELKGLQVTNPNAPMTNLVEVPEMSADLHVRALLMKKAVVESLVVHGVRFGTPRKESGALPDLPPTAGRVTRRLLAWLDQVPVPTLDLSGIIGTVVTIPDITPDSLRSVREARAAVTRADSLRGAWESSFQGLDPRPMIDSTKALVARLQQSDPRQMNATQLASTAAEIHTAVTRVNEQKARVTGVKAQVDSGLAAVRAGVASLDAARQADYAWARNLVHIPSLGAPDVSMALFGDMVKERLKPVMYWVNVAEEHVPPGLDPRRTTGPKRLRMAGTTWEFPLRESWPQFLVQRAEADLAIGGQTVAAGAYRAEVTGATNEPAVYGRPMAFHAERTSSVGPAQLRLGGLMDRTGRIALDSLNAVVPDVRIPSFSIPRAGARIDMGDSSLVSLGLRRTGDQLAGVLRMQSEAVSWVREGDSAAAAGPAPRLGSKEWAEALIWRSLSTLRHVNIEAQLSGPITSPNVQVSSNVGDAVAANLRQALGAEFQRVEQQVRSAVDQKANAVAAQARGKLAELQTQVAQRVAAPAEELAQLDGQLQEQLNRYTQTLPGGVRLPANIPGLPRRPPPPPPPAPEPAKP